MRKLFVIRIVHSPADMGSMRKGLEQEGVDKVGRDRWEENQRRIDRFWAEVDKEVFGLGLDPEKVRVYQDGLPVGGDLGVKIVRETAAKGSRNYEIVEKLINQGATLEATESPELLIKEYELIKSIVEAKTNVDKAMALLNYENVKDGLIEGRDDFIARAVDRSLRDGETGLLFIGAHHDVVPKLPGDIEIVLLD